MNPKDSIFQLIAQGKLEEAVAAWLPLLGYTDPLRNELAQVSARCNALLAEKQRGTLDFKEETLVRNQIMSALLGYFQPWQPSGEEAPLHQAIEQLGIYPGDEIEAVHLVNCDRTKPAKTFRRVFGNRRHEEHFQFYFLCGCPNEMPGSFAKRLIYSIIKDQLEGPNSSIDFPFQEGADRIRTEELPLGDDLEASQKRFKAYVAKRFRFSDVQTFESFIDTGVPQIKKDFVVAVFEVSDKKWDGDEGEIRAYFDWMMRTFRCAHSAVPTFLFFIVVRSPHLWNEGRRTARQSHILEELETLCAGHTAFATTLSDFPPVDAQDFADWLAELGVRNPNHAERVISALATTLKPHERQMFDAENRFHMKDIEIAQKIIYEKAIRRSTTNP